jgi:3-dehydroquinate synthase
MKTILIRASNHSYPVICGPGAVGELRARVRGVRECSGIFVLSSPRVWRSCGRKVQQALGREAGAARPILFDDAEVRKNFRTVEGICRALARARADRGALVIAVGGGVVGDVAGYAAASYLRGVRFANVPTTLLAQVDSAIGGKTGVNLPEGKNLAGAFWAPQFVISDANFLRTLSDREYRAGLYEVIKAGIIGDRALFDYLEKNMRAILRRERRAVAEITERAVRFKARIVTADEREGGARQLLNFGHTIGHALEAAGKYRRLLHGEAVAWGMIGVVLMSEVKGNLRVEDAARMIRLIHSAGTLPNVRLAAGGLKSRALLKLMRTDKKSRGGQVRWVLPTGIGRGKFGQKVDEGLVRVMLTELGGASDALDES